MRFNFPLFRTLAARAYSNIESPFYTLDKVIAIFAYYFEQYELTFGRIHPNIRMAQIENIIFKMPSMDDEFTHDIYAEDYITLIDKHFMTQYRNCNYNINHFFSGDIQLLRFYEELY